MWRQGLVVSFVIACLAAIGCGGGGQYSFAHEYEPTGEERAYMDRAAELSYEEVRRTRPEEQQLVEWFGVVVEPPRIEADGTARVLLSLRAHQDRHLCSTSSSDSCRVTVSERELGRFTAILTVRPEDREGQRRMWAGSLLKVYGIATGEESAETGPVMRVEWYRHFPPHYYVTTASAGSMRR